MKPAFTSKDKIVLHFNRVQPHELKAKTDEILKRKFVDHIATHKFGATYAAKCFVDTIIELSEERLPEPTKKWAGPNKLYINDWVLISSDVDSDESLEDIIEYEYTKEEKKWRLPHPYDQYAQTIAGFHMNAHPQVNDRSRTAKGLDPLPDEVKVKLKLKEKPKYEQRSEKVKSSNRPSAKTPEGAVSLSSICASLKVEPKEARQALRKAKIEKPAAGWQWPEEQRAKVTKQIEEAIKRMKK